MSAKKRLKASRRALRSLSREVDLLTTALEEQEGHTSRFRSDAQTWRAKYEALMSSPEIKADTEAAFKRGAEHMKRSCASFLYETAMKLETPVES